MKMSSHSELYEELDYEWETLIVKARSLGITAEEIRHFLYEKSEQNEEGRNKR